MLRVQAVGGREQFQRFRVPTEHSCQKVSVFRSHQQKPVSASDTADRPKSENDFLPDGNLTDGKEFPHRSDTMEADSLVVDLGTHIVSPPGAGI